MGVVGGGFRNLHVKSLAAACYLSPFRLRLPPRHPLHRTGRGGRSAQIGSGLRVVLLAGESLVLLAIGGMLALHFYMLLVPLSISRSADGAEMRGECALGFGNGANYPRLSSILVTLSSVLPSRSTRPTVVGIYKVA